MARYVYYNNNPEGLNEGDCVIRAITLASGLPYDDVEKKLWFTAELLDCTMLCRFCYGHFLTKILGYKEVDCDGYTVGEFADTHRDGTYLIRVPSHLTVIINGTIYDTWNCSDEFCDMVWKRVD